MINRTDILQKLYEYITIPEYVYEEFLKAPQEIVEYIEYLIELDFLRVKDIETDEEYEVFLKFKRNIYFIIVYFSFIGDKNKFYSDVDLIFFKICLEHFGFTTCT